MLFEIGIISGFLVLIASGIPQKAYRKYHDRIGDGLFWCRSQWQGIRKLTGTVSSVEQLKFENEKIQRSIDKMEIVVRRLYAIRQDMENHLNEWQSVLNFGDLSDSETEEVKAIIDNIKQDIDAVREQYQYCIEQQESYRHLLNQSEMDLQEAEASLNIAKASLKNHPSDVSKRLLSLKKTARRDSLAITGDISGRKRISKKTIE